MKKRKQAIFLKIADFNEKFSCNGYMPYLDPNLQHGKPILTI